MKRSAKSIATYNLMEKNHLLSKRRMEVYSILFKHGALTAHEVVSIARGKSPNANQTGWNARFSELAKMGVIEAVGEKINPVSKVHNTIWDITGSLPGKLPKPLTKKEKLEKISRLIQQFLNNTDTGSKDPNRTLLENAIVLLKDV